MKASRDARNIRNNTLSRVRVARDKGKVIPCLDSESLAHAIDSVLCRKGRSMVCEHCDRFLAFGDKESHTLSPSLHKIRPELGYVTGNLAVLCFDATRRSASRAMPTRCAARLPQCNGNLPDSRGDAKMSQRGKAATL